MTMGNFQVETCEHCGAPATQFVSTVYVSWPTDDAAVFAGIGGAACDAHDDQVAEKANNEFGDALGDNEAWNLTWAKLPLDAVQIEAWADGQVELMIAHLQAHERRN